MFLKWVQWMIHLVISSSIQPSSCWMFILLTGLSALLCNGNTKEIYIYTYIYIHYIWWIYIYPLKHNLTHVRNFHISSSQHKVSCTYMIKGYIWAAISFAELLPFTHFLEVQWQDRDCARTRAFCPTHNLWSSSLHVAMKIGLGIMV